MSIENSSSGLGKPLRYSVIGHRRIRVGDCRIVYRVDGKSKTVIIGIIKHRKEVYEE
ncbi:MAG: type II toxin-antitoxin system RelE/ParE family toxin [Deltaproteobacteria bacterium]|nr:type II toxin-antitoxin system RelE/ParE family toxin [Deltaproteobacteria bacterium]